MPRTYHRTALRPGITVLAVAAVLAAGLPPAAAAPAVWQAPLAVGPGDVADLSARDGLLVAAGRPVQKEVFQDGAFVTAPVPSPRQPGLFASLDGGRTWRRGLRAGTTEPITDVADRVLVTSATSALAVIATAVWASEDAAATWRPVGALPGPATALALLPDGRIAAGLASGGLTASADGGRTWAASASGLPGGRVNDVLGLSATVVLAATDSGLYRSTDGGLTFTLSGTGLHSTSMAVLAVAGSTELFRGVYLAMPGQSLTSTVVYSTANEGATWVFRGALYSQNLSPRLTPGALEVAVPGSSTVLYAGTSSGLFRADFPQSVSPLTWTRLDPEPGAVTVNALALDDTDPGPARAEAVFAGLRRASVWVAGPGSLQRFAAPGWYDQLEGGRVCGGLVRHVAGDLVAACGRHVLRSADDGATWQPSGSGLPYISAGIGDTPYSPLAAGADGTLWASGYAYGLYRSDPAGRTWSKIAIPAASVALVAPDPRDSSVVYASGVSLNGSSSYVLWRSADRGVTWEAILVRSSPFYAVDVSRRGPKRVLALTFEEGAFVSQDGGRTFSVASGLPYGSDHHGHRAAYSAAQDGLAYAVVTHLLGGTKAEWVLYRSLDGGHAWEPLGPIGFQTSKGWVDFMPNDLVPSPWHAGTAYFTTSSIGVGVTRDAGATFGLLNPGLYAGYVDALMADAAEPGRLWTANGPHGAGADPPSMWILRGDDSGAQTG